MDIDSTSLLENDKLRLRALDPEDLELLYRWENDTKLWAYAQAVSPYSRLALREYISNSIDMDIFDARQLRLMIDLKAENVTIGTIDLYDINIRNSHGGIGILIDEAYRREGYAYQALLLMQEYVFNFLKLHQTYVHIGANNESSLKLFAKAGYIQTGLLKEWTLTISGQYEDVVVMQYLNNQK